MPENPLLPHRKLRELYKLMLRCRDLDRAQAHRPGAVRAVAREAVLAATSIHLLPGDLLCAEPGDRTAAQLAPASKSAAAAAVSPPSSPYLAICAAMARGLQASGSEGVVLAYVTVGFHKTSGGNKGTGARTTAGWSDALEWAQHATLPLLLTCLDATSPRRSSGRPVRSAASPLTLSAVTALARKLRLPVMPVDAEDAVAVYRVMQECVIRARHGGGPAVIWAIMTPSATLSARLPRASQPIVRLQQYLAVRKISLPR